MSETAKALIWSAVLSAAIVGIVWLTESAWPAIP